MNNFKNNYRRNRFKSNGDRNFRKRNGNGHKINGEFNNNLDFKRKNPGRNNQNASKLIDKYNSEEYSFEIIESGGGYQFLTKNIFSRLNEILLKQQSRRRLSISALETLSIIAYKQPVTKSEIENAYTKRPKGMRFIK